MRAIIYRVDQKNKTIWIKKRGSIHILGLSNKMAKTYMPVLFEGILIDYEDDLSNLRTGRIAHINQIISLKHYKVLFDTKQLRRDIRKVLKHIKHYVFIDFEMSMPPFGHKGKGFQTEIIQYGYVVTNQAFEILETGSNYVYTKSHSFLSDRTLKFLKINLDTYLEEAISYHTFYDMISRIQETYQPKFVIWGKNDSQVIQDSYQIHEKTSITQSKDFIDALKLHKDYYDLKDDLGLLTAYNMYYPLLEDQEHHAYHDAYMTYMIFKAFYDNMKKGY